MAGYRIDRELTEFGEHIRQWRMVLGVTAQQTIERAGISRATLRKFEKGDASVSFSSVAQVLRALGQLDTIVEATDPLRTDIGRIRADRLTRRRTQ